jgi:hypothetical protein
MSKELTKEIYPKIIVSAYKKYVDWWTPIDIACNSCLAPMCMSLFIQTLLTYDESNWFHRWIDINDLYKFTNDNNDINSIKISIKISIKRYILKATISHTKGWIDLDDKSGPFEWTEEYHNYDNTELR